MTGRPGLHADQPATLDIAANRRARKWSRRALAGRALWELAQPLFAFSPRQLWGWRNLLLRCFGARIGHGVRVHPTVRIAVPWNVQIGEFAAVGDRAILYSLGPVHIGARATVSQHAHLCAGSHDHLQPDLPLLKPPIRIGDDVWVCADAFIGPGVTVGDFAVVGARAVVTKDVAAAAIVVGNPARVVGQRPGAPSA